MGKVAFVFPGQGTQSPGMGRAFYDALPAAKSIFDRFTKQYPELLSLCFSGPAERLNQTLFAQPCLFAAEYCSAKMLEENGIFPDAAAGFSLGEIPAAAFGGLMDAGDAFRFTLFRAKEMQRAAELESGSMAAVLRLSSSGVEKICDGIPGCYPANYNSPGQTVVAYTAASGDSLEQKVGEAGGRFVKLAVSGAFHSPLMNPAAERIAAYLKTVSFCPPKLPVYSNVTAEIYGDPAELLSRQVVCPVRWQQTVAHLLSRGFDRFVEVGPGRTLSGLIKKICPDAVCCQVSDPASLANTIQELQHVS